MKKFLEEFKAFALKGNMIDLAVGMIIGSAFTSIHYEMEVTANGFEWLVHSTDMFPVGTEVGIRVDPFDIQIMNKPASEDEEAVSIDE